MYKHATGGDLSDLPHMLVWGGAGTRMDIDLAAMVRSRWVRALRDSQPRHGGSASGETGMAGVSLSLLAEAPESEGGAEYRRAGG